MIRISYVFLYSLISLYFINNVMCADFDKSERSNNDSTQYTIIKGAVILIHDKNATKNDLKKQIDSLLGSSDTEKEAYSIVKASYGVGSFEEESVDVTAILQEETKDKAYRFAGGPGSMNKLFGDPAVGTKKILKIIMTNDQGQKIIKIIKEDQSFTLP